MSGPDNTIITVLGRKGSGKSTLVFEMIEEHKRVVVFDTLGEYDKGFDVYQTREECIKALLRVEESRRFRLSFRLLHIEDALGVMEVMHNMTRFLLVVEETSFYCSPTTLPPELAFFVRYGRHMEIDQIYVSRRPAEIHRDLTAQSDLIVTFRQTEPRDIEYLRSVMGPVAERTPSLPPYKVLISGELEKAPLAVLARLDKKALTEPRTDL